MSKYENYVVFLFLLSVCFSKEQINKARKIKREKGRVANFKKQTKRKSKSKSKQTRKSKINKYLYYIVFIIHL
jgi:hypothetical protein